MHAYSVVLSPLFQVAVIVSIVFFVGIGISTIFLVKGKVRNMQNKMQYNSRL